MDGVDQPPGAEGDVSDAKENNETTVVSTDSLSPELLNPALPESQFLQHQGIGLNPEDSVSNAGSRMSRLSKASEQAIDEVIEIQRLQLEIKLAQEREEREIKLAQEREERERKKIDA